MAVGDGLAVAAGDLVALAVGDGDSSASSVAVGSAVSDSIGSIGSMVCVSSLDGDWVLFGVTETSDSAAQPVRVKATTRARNRRMQRKTELTGNNSLGLWSLYVFTSSAGQNESDGD
ncbi:unannotated protein [freshwater metagenome]|uniref:Unannotated protein n=1 Tax=freshwater metagenome TaxID=449393 RepID=A0A6J6BZA1_9ZZZZ